MMRYRIYCGAYPLTYSREELLLDTQDAETKQMLHTARNKTAVNKAGGLTAALLKGHRMYDDINLMATEIEVWDGTEPIWHGRPYDIKTDRLGKKTVEFEGNLNYLMDVPDTLTNPPNIVKHYKIGSESAAAELSFTEQTADGEGTGLYEHRWTAGEFESLYVSEFYKTFFVEYDGNVYELFLNRLDEYAGNPPTLLHVGFIGCMNLYDETYAKTTDDTGSSAPFYIENSGIYTKDTAASHTVRIWRRDPLTIQQMFQLMFTDGAGYNGYTSQSRYLLRGECDIEGSMIYNPELDDTCLDTLRKWQEIFGGYVYTTYDHTTGKWKINYTKNAGSDRYDVPVRIGLNLTDIETDESGEGMITAIAGIGIDDQDETKINLAGSPSITPRTGFTLDASTGYVRLDSAKNAYGWIRKQRVYSIPHGTQNPHQALYDMVCDDLLAAQTGRQAVRASAIDARLLGENAGRPQVGDRVPINAAPYGVDGDMLMLTEMEIDFLRAGRGNMQFGGERPPITQMI